MKQPAAANTSKDKVTFSNRQLSIEAVLFLMAIFAIYLFISLISFDPADPSWSQTAWHEPIQNWGGAMGAYCSDIFLQFFGFAAYCIPFLILLMCGQLAIYFYRRAQSLEQHAINFFSASIRILGLFSFLFSLTGFLALNVNDWVQYQAGGILGSLIVQAVLPIFNHIGSTLFFLGFIMVGVTLLTGYSWLYIAEKVGAAVVWIVTPIFILFSWLSRRREMKKAQKTYDDEEELIELSDEPLDTQLPIPHLDDVNHSQIEEPTESVEIQVDNPIAQDAVVVENNLVTEAVATTTDEDEIANLQADEELNHIVAETIPDDENQYTIDNSFPPPYSEIQHHDSELPTKNEFAINQDYYSPLAEEQKLTAESTVIENEEEVMDIAPIGAYSSTIEQDIFGNEIVPETNSHTDEWVTAPAIAETSIVEPEIAQEFVPELEIAEEIKPELEEPVTKHVITKENINDSLIHPLLMKNDKPMVKPTTPLPSLNLLTNPPVKQETIDHEALKARAQLIEKSLSDFRVKARVVDYLPGPVITRFEIELAPGVKAARISTLDRDLARSLSMPSVRVVEVIPGKPYVGLELPNKNRETVYFREVLDSPQFREAKSPLTIVLGKDIAGQSVVADLAKMPHVLVAGTTGSGKSVGVNAMILSVLYKSKPEDVRFIMIDPKMLELSVYEGIPHLLTEVVTDMKDAANALNWCVNEMERRYRLMSALGVRNIAGYNEKIALAEEMGRPIPDPLWKPTDSMDIDIPMLEKLPYIVVLVDEFADLIMAVGKKVEELIARLAQKARAAGIHLVLATQRPSVDVITGLIKANIPTRIAFTVSSKIDSRTILDQMGAESLLGMGDMLYLAPNSSIPIRVHGAFVRDEEVHAVVQDWKARGTPKYIDNITASSDDGEGGGIDGVDEELDPLFDQVVAFVVDKRRASISSVQRQFRIGYNRAARIVEQMETQGIVSTPNHSGNREVLAPPSHGDY